MSVEEGSLTSTASQTLQSQQIREICNTLINAKIESGFAHELRIEDATYLRSFQDAVDAAVRASQRSSSQLLALVETRIPFKRQLELLGIDLNPAVFYGVRLPQSGPYAVFLEVVRGQDAPFTQGANYTEAVRALPENLLPASPLEGINADFQEILAQGFVALPGGEYDMPGIFTGGSTRFRTLCLETYLGRPRISHISFAERDALVGMLTAYKQ